MLAKGVDNVPTPPKPVTCNSFSPDTLVLMADGSTKPIKEISTGDLVLASNPETGKTEARQVSNLHFNIDRLLTTITVAVTGGQREIINTTWEHPIWSETQKKWVAASELTPGEELATLSGQVVRVTTVNNFTGISPMHNLTINGFNTYYVLAGDTPVLVDNAGPGGQRARPRGAKASEADQ